MFEKFLNKRVLNNFFSIELNSGESMVAIGSVQNKYAVAARKTILYLLISLPAILLLDTDIIISVLIPITMVAGTAWFSISLANMKQKFENFGLELTTNLFEAFSVSLGLLFVISAFSISSFLWQPYVNLLPYQNSIKILAFVFMMFTIGNICYKIFIGSIKYDINDAMLAGQNEAAERFFRKSLSLLSSVADSLRSGKSTQVANYYIGVAFFEIFSFIKKTGVANGKLPGYMDEANKLIKNPSMSQEEADEISFGLITTYMSYCRNPQTEDSEKSVEAINDELWALKNNNEDQEMVDTRFAIIFQEVASLLEGQGETLFVKQTNNAS